MPIHMTIPDHIRVADLAGALASVGLQMRHLPGQPEDARYLAEIPAFLRQEQGSRLKPEPEDPIRNFKADLRATPIIGASEHGPRSSWAGLRYRLPNGQTIEMQILSAGPGIVRTRSSCPESISIELVKEDQS